MKQLVSHLSGIRHYTKKERKDAAIEEAKSDEKEAGREKKKKKANGSGSHDTDFKEFFLNQKFESVAQALTIFKDDELLSKPGPLKLIPQTQIRCRLVYCWAIPCLC